MAHFAKIDENNIVTQVIVVHNNELLVDGEESETKGIDFCESLFGHRNWVQTSYNNNIRYNFAGIGNTWDSENDAFYEPQPYPSWSLDENYIWQSPVPMPEDASTEKIYEWDEDNQEWKVQQIGE
tara:strand:- start:6692 stop:7066 length:375 start_codon:yes stop_codon:yes gene_type:complete